MKKKNDPAQATVYAAIDIGSNAARLLIKKRNNKTNMFDKCLLLRVPLRLGFDVFSIGKLSAKKEENLTRLMKTYRQLMKIYDVECFRACATSAMRDALNGPDIIKSIKKKTGIQIEIISGQEEAHRSRSSAVRKRRKSSTATTWSAWKTAMAIICTSMSVVVVPRSTC